MKIPDEKYPLFEKIMSGEVHAWACALWTDIRQWWPGKYVKLDCCMCGTASAMDEKSLPIFTEKKAVVLCFTCANILMELTGVDREKATCYYEGKAMTYRQAEHLAIANKRRN